MVRLVGGPVADVDWLDGQQAITQLEEAQLDQTAGWSFPDAHILVVDDGPENRELVKLVLENYGLLVDEAENGQVGLDMARATPYDVVLMDVQMPVMDGFTATRAMRSDGLKMPIIALTANAMKGFEQECLDVGYTDYFTKPIDIDSFVAKLAEILVAQQDVDGQLRQRAAVNGPGLPQSGATLGENTPIASSLDSKDEAFAQLAGRFAARLGDKLDEMNAAWQGREYPVLADLAHWLKGAGGTVGFDVFTAPARRLESAAKAEDDDAIGAAMNGLLDTAGRVPEVTLSIRAVELIPPDRPVQSDSSGESDREAPDDGPIVSRLAGHARMQILIDRFVSQLTDADAAMAKAWEMGDLETLAKTSRWIKGSAGTLGFDVFTEPAEELESCIAAGDRNRIPALVDQIHDFVTRVQKGAPTADTESDAVA